VSYLQTPEPIDTKFGIGNDTGDITQHAKIQNMLLGASLQMGEISPSCGF